MTNPRPIRNIAVIILLLAAVLLSVIFKSGYNWSLPFFQEGDTYFHGMLANFIVDTGRTTTYVPYQYPPVANGYPQLFHILVAQIHQVTEIPVVDILRWFGIVISGLFALAIYALVNHLTRHRLGAVVAAIMSSFVPFLSGRLSITLPENVLVFYIPVVLLLLIFANKKHAFSAIAIAIFITISAIGYHYSSYFLYPAVGLGLLIYFLGSRWQKRNFLYLPIVIIVSFFVSVLIFTDWWVFRFLSTFFQQNVGSAIAGDNPVSSFSQPAPSYAQWIAQLGWWLVIFSLAGSIFFIVSRSYAWRAKVILITFISTILLPLLILPLIKVFSYLPFRAFVYIAPALLVLFGVFLTEIRGRRSATFITAFSALIILTQIPNTTAATEPGAGEQNLTLAEYEGGLRWLSDTMEPDDIVITAPANGRQLSFFLKKPIAYDTSHGVFYAKDSLKAVEEINSLGTFRHKYIYISKYKLGPVYNFGWVRDYAYVTADLQKFQNRRFFYVAFEDAESIIYSLTADRD